MPGLTGHGHEIVNILPNGRQAHRDDEKSESGALVPVIIITTAFSAAYDTSTVFLGLLYMKDKDGSLSSMIGIAGQAQQTSVTLFYGVFSYALCYPSMKEGLKEIIAAYHYGVPTKDFNDLVLFPKHYPHLVITARTKRNTALTLVGSVAITAGVLDAIDSFTYIRDVLDALGCPDALSATLSFLSAILIGPTTILMEGFESYDSLRSFGRAKRKKFRIENDWIHYSIKSLGYFIKYSGVLGLVIETYIPVVEISPDKSISAKWAFWSLALIRSLSDSNFTGKASAKALYALAYFLYYRKTNFAIGLAFSLATIACIEIADAQRSLTMTLVTPEDPIYNNNTGLYDDVESEDTLPYDFGYESNNILATFYSFVYLGAAQIAMLYAIFYMLVLRSKKLCCALSNDENEAIELNEEDSDCDEVTAAIEESSSDEDTSSDEENPKKQTTPLEPIPMTEPLLANKDPLSASDEDSSDEEEENNLRFRLPPKETCSSQMWNFFCCRKTFAEEVLQELQRPIPK